MYSVLKKIPEYRYPLCPMAAYLVFEETLLEKHPPTYLTEIPYGKFLIKIIVDLPTHPPTPTKVGILKHVDPISWKSVSVRYQPWYTRYSCSTPYQRSQTKKGFPITPAAVVVLQ
jgi:hypothetical protein